MTTFKLYMLSKFLGMFHVNIKVEQIKFINRASAKNVLERLKQHSQQTTDRLLPCHFQEK